MLGHARASPRALVCHNYFALQDLDCHSQCVQLGPFRITLLCFQSQVLPSPSETQFMSLLSVNTRVVFVAPVQLSPTRPLISTEIELPTRVHFLTT